MGQVVNLRLRRKQAVRRQAIDKAAENRLTHGRSKAERTLQATQSARARRHIEAHRLETGDRE
jgi:hypothetical protein